MYKKVLCPYCGHSMTSRMMCYLEGSFKAWYECNKCGSRSPLQEMKGKPVQVQAASRAAALRRYTPSEDIRKAARVEV